MDNTNHGKAILLLEDGSIYYGLAAGMIGTAVGEICFNTGMTGYQEVFTDPSYYGQVMVTTNVHIGNYGVNNEEVESEKVQIAGLVCRNFNNGYSRHLADKDLDEYFQDNKIVCIHGVDTRMIVKKIRTEGAMNCIISSEIFDIDELKLRLNQAPSMEGMELASKVTTSEPYYLGNENAPVRISVLDFGTKKNILRCFVERGAYLKVFPAKSSVKEVLAFEPDGIFLSNGPGDPAAMTYAVDTVKGLLETNIPIFGICLGHQLLGLGLNIKTEKMHHGHRGINHPVKNILTGYCEITSQNHGFVITKEALATNENVEMTHINLNDDSVEGLRVKNRPAFSVQYHPEAAPGPHDSRYLFDDFIELINNNKN
jgi:carbamoyl-phosphate synthase small subunit